MNSRYTAVVFLLILAGAFVRLYGLGVWDYFYDEAWHVYVARQPTLAAIFYTNLTEDGHPPLLYFLWHYLLGIWNNPWMARLPSLVCGILAIPMGYLLGRELFASRNGGLFAAFFMAFSNLMIEQSDVVRGYTVMMLFCMIAIWSVYRYRDTARLTYVFTYCLSIAIALLCEFPAIPIAAFTGLYTLNAIYKQPKRDLIALLLIAVTNIALITYLLAFNHLLHTIGALNFSQKIFVKSASSNIAILSYISFFLDYINDSAFFFHISVASYSQVLYITELFLFLFASIAGFVWLVRERRWWLLALVVLPIATAMAFQHFGIVPLDFRRRHMALSFSVMILFYGGFCYMLNQLPKRSIITASPIAFALAVTAFICIGYAAYGTQWRAYRWFEFELTLHDRKEFFSFLKEHARKDDVIITDWGTYYQFWNDRPCPTTPVSPMVNYYPCYDVPVFIEHTHGTHLEVFKENPRDFQEAVQQLDRAGRLKNAGTIWIVGLQLRDFMPLALAMHFHPIAFDFLNHHEEYRPEATMLMNEQQAFARTIYGAARFKRIAYAYSCGIDDNEVVIGGEDECMMKFMLLALPKKAMDEELVNHPAYHDPRLFLQRLQNDLGH